MNTRILGRPRVPNASGEIVVTVDSHWFDLWRELEASLLQRIMRALAEGQLVQATKLGRRKQRARERGRIVVRRMVAAAGGRVECGR